MLSGGYRCRFPECTAKYQRKEHLSRHEAQHTRRKVLQCPTCSREFGRSDTLRRHIQTVHGIAEPTQIKHACTHCRNQKIRCHGGPPCTNCERRGADCSLHKPAEVPIVRGQRDPGPPESPNEAPDTQSQSQSQSATRQSIPHQPRLRRTAIEDRFVSIYFELFHPHWPFIHRGTFIEFETPLLVQSMVAIGLWMTGEEKERSKAVDLHDVLGKAIRQQTEQWDGSESEDATPSCKWPIPTYQAILLHIISAGMMMSNPGPLLQPDLKPSLAPADADLLYRLVASCKRLGMFYYPNILARFSEKEPPQYVWVNIEEVKRFNLALFKLCSALSSGASRPGQHHKTSVGARLAADKDETANWGFPARELQFPLPRNTPLWNALTPEEWFAADTPDVYRYSLHETLEEQWISKSAAVLEIMGT